MVLSRDFEHGACRLHRATHVFQCSDRHSQSAILYAILMTKWTATRCLPREWVSTKTLDANIYMLSIMPLSLSLSLSLIPLTCISSTGCGLCRTALEHLKERVTWDSTRAQRTRLHYTVSNRARVKMQRRVTCSKRPKLIACMWLDPRTMMLSSRLCIDWGLFIVSKWTNLFDLFSDVMVTVSVVVMVTGEHCIPWKQCLLLQKKT